MNRHWFLTAMRAQPTAFDPSYVTFRPAVHTQTECEAEVSRIGRLRSTLPFALDQVAASTECARIEIRVDDTARAQAPRI
ncbi:hypothetical protein [Streptodolium elevatio]